MSPGAGCWLLGKKLKKQKENIFDKKGSCSENGRLFLFGFLEGRITPSAFGHSP
jgi:hypothetical protein